MLRGLEVDGPVAIIYNGTEHWIPLDGLECRLGKRLRSGQVLEKDTYAGCYIVSTIQRHICLIGRENCLVSTAPTRRRACGVNPPKPPTRNRGIPFFSAKVISSATPGTIPSPLCIIPPTATITFWESMSTRRIADKLRFLVSASAGPPFPTFFVTTNSATSVMASISSSLRSSAHKSDIINVTGFRERSAVCRRACRRITGVKVGWRPRGGWPSPE